MNEPGPQITQRRPGLRIRQRFARGLAISLLVLPVTGLQAPPGPDGLTLRYVLQEANLDADRRERLRSYLGQARAGASYLLVQGFACDTGGYEVSLRVARQRGTAIAAALQDFPDYAAAAPGESRVRVADPAVLHGEGREAYRRGELRRFRNAAERDRALAGANRAAARWNEAARKFLNDRATSGDAEVASTTESNRGTGAGDAEGALADGPSHSRLELYFVLGLLLLLLLIGLIWLYAGRRADPSRHVLDPEEAEALEILTGGEVSPVPAATSPKGPANAAAAASGDSGRRRRSAKSAGADANEASAGVSALATGSGPIHDFIDRARNQTMGVKKKSKTKITPISIRGAVDRDFEEKSLGELSRAPIHALEGLTPRHARMMEEAFGVKTVEDLARLKYVEIARAIVVLSRYEK